MKKTLIVFMLVLLSAVLMVSCDDNANVPSAKSYKAGDTIDLGSKGEDAITWIVLAVDTEDNTALLISNDILESSAFGSSTAYNGSTVRNRLKSDDFFTNYGLKTDYMVNVDVTTAIEETEKNTGDDYVFLLSNTEYGKYKSTIAIASSDWWLRSPYDSTDVYTVVSTTGNTGHEYLRNAGSPSEGIRPAFWCKLSEISD